MDGDPNSYRPRVPNGPQVRDPSWMPIYRGAVAWGQVDRAFEDFRNPNSHAILNHAAGASTPARGVLAPYVWIPWRCCCEASALRTIRNSRRPQELEENLRRSSESEETIDYDHCIDVGRSTTTTTSTRSKYDYDCINSLHRLYFRYESARLVVIS